MSDKVSGAYSALTLAERRIRRMRKALKFARSVIKSGEPWTEECERTIGRAIKDGL